MKATDNASSTEQQAGQGMSEENFTLLKSEFSAWYDDHRCLTMLKVLFRDSVDNGKLSEITCTIDLLNELVTSGQLSSTDRTLLYDIIKITEHFALLHKINEKMPLYKEVAVSKFTDHRQKIMKFGMELTPGYVSMIDRRYNTPLKMYADGWSLITDLEKSGEICESNMEIFIGSLENLNLHRAVNALKGRTIPSGISFHGPAVEKVYIEALEEGAVEVNLGMVKVIGQERVGKTCLINACLGKKFNPKEEITDAIATIKIVTNTTEEPNKWGENFTDTGSATEVYQKCMADEIIRKSMAVKRIDGSSSEKRKTKPEKRIEKVVSTISEKGAGSSKEVQMKTKSPRVKIHAFKNETMPTVIRHKAVVRFHQRKKPGMRKWHKIDEETFNIWDYGGQVIYHGIHRIFMTSEAVYIVVFNLNVDLDAKAIVQDSSGRKYTHHLTNLEFILYWIMSVYTHSRQLTDDMIREIGLPAIVLTGTHLDSLGANEEERTRKVEDVFKKIGDALKGKPYRKHVYPKYFAIENDRPGIDENVAELKKGLQSLMTALVKTVPLKWMHFQCELQKLRIEKQLLVCPLKEVKDLATNCGIDDEKTQHVLLNFLYDLGEIIYMPDNDALKDNVVLDPMGFVDIVKTVITVIPPRLRGAMFINSFEELDKGVLEEKLLKHLWRKRGVDLNNFDFFVELMRRFSFLCERKTSKTPTGTRSFFVPLRLAFEPLSEEQRQVDTFGNRAISIYHDFCGYLPDELFPQLVTEFINQFQTETDEPQLAHAHAELYFDQHHHVILSLVTFETKQNEQKRMLRTTILRRKTINEAKTDCEPSSKACKQVLEFLEASFKRSQQGGRRGIKFERCIPCICSKKSTKKHMQMLGNFEEMILPCKRDGMDVTRYKLLFGTTDNASSTVQQAVQGISEEDFNLLKSEVSAWYDDHRCLTMLKVLFRDYVDLGKLSEITHTIDLLNVLVTSDDLSLTDLTLLHDTIKITKHFALLRNIKEKLPWFPEEVVLKFTNHRQKLMKFGMELTPNDVRKIDGQYNTPLKMYADSWSLITDLEKSGKICKSNMEIFIGSLENLNLHLAVNTLKGFNTSSTNKRPNTTESQDFDKDLDEPKEKRGRFGP